MMLHQGQLITVTINEAVWMDVLYCNVAQCHEEGIKTGLNFIPLAP